jgi:hypothetical protein
MGPIMTLPLPAGAPVVLVAGQNDAIQLTLRGTTLYWIDYGGPDGNDSLWQLPERGAPVPISLPRIPGLDGLTIGGNGAYWKPTDQVNLEAFVILGVPL